MIVPIILAGGSGERLWPLSRAARPKQFLTLFGDKHSMLQNTALRLPGKEGNVAPPIVITQEQYRFQVAEHLRSIGLPPTAIILEPTGLNTAPAVTAAVHYAMRIFKDPLCLVLPADHLIENDTAFHTAITEAATCAGQGFLTTFGIPPTHPETGYGYICAGDAIANTPGFRVQRFYEKPDAPTAAKFVQDKQFFWNSGMFLFHCHVFQQEMGRYQSEMLQHTDLSLTHALQDLDFIRLDATHYAACEAISLDYALMEPTQRAAMVPFNTGWSDLGNWQALWENGSQDRNHNCLQGNVYPHATHDCLIDARSRLVATVGVSDLAIIETTDAVLVADKRQSGEIKTLVKKLKDAKVAAATEHQQILRPWGWYEQIAIGNRFQVKRIVVKPGMSLSLQMHQHRSEHWVVVVGMARVIRGEAQFDLGENESTFIPQGIKHRLSNIGKIPLEVIEVQSGSYLGEDDIIRFEDNYGRQTIDEANLTPS